MNSWHSYPSIYNLGHRVVKDLLTVPHYIEEKVDGSQFSFGLHPVMEPVGALMQEVPGVFELKVRSKGAVMHPDAPEGMFKKAVESVKERRHLLRPGWTYRGEYLAKPKHNALVYNRTPNGYIVIFDINPSEEDYLTPEEKRVEAERIGLECVPVLRAGQPTSLDDIRGLLQTESFLEGQKIEGVVVKQLPPVQLYGMDKKALIGKFVSEAFKEVHAKAWKESNPNAKDVVQKLIDGLTSPARWQKAVLHLKEKGVLTGTPRDIGALIEEVKADILKEETDTIKDVLFNHSKGDILRGVTKGLPEWYKEELLKAQFE